jgi:ubiquinone/menaquinone biosynthesis C-methylase UbiE
MIKTFWNKTSAKKYEAYSRRYPMYKKTSRFLVNLSKIKKEMVVLDLACGTGTTLKEILNKLKKTGKIIGIDSSKDMINIAEKKFKQKNISLFCLPAEKIDGVIKEKADLILCNSAFWQIKTSKLLTSVRKILKNKGKFIFNLPGQCYKFSTKPKKVKNVTILQNFDNIAIKKYGAKLKNVKKQNSWDFNSINKILKDNNFKIISFKILKNKRTVKDQYEFLKIPLMTSNRFFGLNYSKRMKILKEAYKKTKKINKIENKWIFFVVKKKN